VKVAVVVMPQSIHRLSDVYLISLTAAFPLSARPGESGRR
jgi:hypothetical protein